MESVPEVPDFQTDQEINMSELLYRLLDHYMIIVAAALGCALIAVAYSLFIATPKYQAVAKLYVTNSKDSVFNYQDLQSSSFLTSDYQELIKTWQVHEMVREALALHYSDGQLEKMLTISNPIGTRIVNIMITSDDPKEAADIANTYATASKQYISYLIPTIEPIFVSMAQRPTAPISPNKKQNVFLALLFGGFAACVVITLRFVFEENKKSRLYTTVRIYDDTSRGSFDG